MKRSTLILSVLLVLSAAGNLAVLGIFAGHWMRGGGDRPPSSVDRLMGLVPPPLRPEIDAVVRNRDEEVQTRVQALRDARRAVGEALRQRPFDAAQAEAALTDLRLQTGRIQEKLHRTVVERMSAAQAAGTLPPPPPDHGKGKPDDKPPPGK
ncbi:periplasmic heavy metal sensor [Niveispirillum sp. KHB5.9]|uniref:periplasmic heavy metal sensor n=1 Tax=Niveispirillum sp. KHB5.9 TaxID=3400269 RepID=UPI003A862450